MQIYYTEFSKYFQFLIKSGRIGINGMTKLPEGHQFTLLPNLPKQPRTNCCAHLQFATHFAIPRFDNSRVLGTEIAVVTWSFS